MIDANTSLSLEFSDTMLIIPAPTSFLCRKIIGRNGFGLHVTVQHRRDDISCMHDLISLRPRWWGGELIELWKALRLHVVQEHATAAAPARAQGKLETEVARREV